MYESSNENWNSIILIFFLVLITPGLLYISFALFIMGLLQVTNYINFTNPYFLSVSYYTASIIIITLSLISFKQMDKKKWPQVTGEILKTTVIKGPLSGLKQWTLSYTYKYNYNGKNYTKMTNSKIVLDNEYEGQKFREKSDVMKRKYLPVYVFKYYPKFSSTEAKMNIFHIFLLYLVIMINFNLIILGFVARIASNFDIVTNPDTGFVEQMNQIFNLYVAKADYFLILLPIVIFILLLIFIIKSIGLLRKNGVYLLFTKIDPDVLSKKIAYELPVNFREKKICPKCRSKSEKEAKFCSDCGIHF